MSENTLKACLLGLMGLTIVVLGVCIIAGHNSVIVDGLLTAVGGVSAIGIWERLKR